MSVIDSFCELFSYAPPRVRLNSSDEESVFAFAVVAYQVRQSHLGDKRLHLRNEYPQLGDFCRVQWGRHVFSLRK